MAANTLAQRQEEFKEQFLTCSICDEPYDTGEHRAKCLPCLHTFCKSCLQLIIDGAGSTTIDCPTCRKEAALPEGTVDGLLNSFMVENLRDYHDEVVNLAIERQQTVRFCHVDLLINLLIINSSF